MHKISVTEYIYAKWNSGKQRSGKCHGFFLLREATTSFNVLKGCQTDILVADSSTDSWL